MDEPQKDQQPDAEPVEVNESDEAIAGSTIESSEESSSESLAAEVEALRDKNLRLSAELDNVRKRTARELSEERRYASMPLVRELLPVMDNLQRAIEAAEKQPDIASLLAGVKLMAQQLDTVLAANHCTRIEAVEQPFDPNLHEAILQQPSDEHPPGTVLLETQTGYQLHDRVVRPSQVIVSKAPEQQ